MFEYFSTNNSNVRIFYVKQNNSIIRIKVTSLMQHCTDSTWKKNRDLPAVEILHAFHARGPSDKRSNTISVTTKGWFCTNCFQNRLLFLWRTVCCPDDGDDQNGYALKSGDAWFTPRVRGERCRRRHAARRRTHVMAPTTFFLIVATATAAANGDGDGGRTVIYPRQKDGGLVCYKDRRTDGGAFWTYASDAQRRPHIFHCPSSLSAWCVNVATGRLSERGCSGPTGVNRAGCFHVTNADRNVTSEVCLCKRDYCNAAAAAAGPTGTTSLLAAAAMATAVRWMMMDGAVLAIYYRAKCWFATVIAKTLDNVVIMCIIIIVKIWCFTSEMFTFIHINREMIFEHSVRLTIVSIHFIHEHPIRTTINIT